MVICPLETNTVYPYVSTDPLVWFIGEAPGEEEDKQGIPFVGRAGKLLRQWLHKFKLTDHIALGNACMHRPYDVGPEGTRINWNRDPTEEEIEACLPVLEKYLSRHKPMFVVFVGGVSAKALGGYKGTVGRMVGRWSEWKGIPCTVIYHPSAFLRPIAKSKRSEMELMNFGVLASIAKQCGLAVANERAEATGPCKENDSVSAVGSMGWCLPHLRGYALAKIVNHGWPRMMAGGKVKKDLNWCGFLREATVEELEEVVRLLK